MLVESHKSMSKLTGYDAKNVLHHWDSFGSPPFLVPQNGALAPGRWVEMGVTRMGSTMVYHGVYILHMVHHGIIQYVIYSHGAWQSGFILSYKAFEASWAPFQHSAQASVPKSPPFWLYPPPVISIPGHCAVPNYDSACIRQSFSAWKDETKKATWRRENECPPFWLYPPTVVSIPGRWNVVASGYQLATVPTGYRLSSVWHGSSPGQKSVEAIRWPRIPMPFLGWGSLFSESKLQRIFGWSASQARYLQWTPPEVNEKCIPRKSVHHFPNQSMATLRKKHHLLTERSWKSSRKKVDSISPTKKIPRVAPKFLKP